MTSDVDIPPEVETYFAWRQNETVKTVTFVAGASIFLLAGSVEVILSPYLVGQGGWVHALMIGVAVLLGFPVIFMERHAARLLRASAIMLGLAAVVVLVAVAAGELPGNGRRALPLGLLGVDILLWIGVIVGTQTSTWLAFSQWCKKPTPKFGMSVK